jgi:predicted methyltransferase
MKIFLLRVAMASAAVLALPGSLYAKDRIPAYIAAAVADSARPDADRQRDGNRRPAETLTFAGIKPGNQVVELVPGGGYYTRLLSKVVGPRGKVYAVMPAPRADAPKDAPDRTVAVRAIAADPNYSNVTVLVQPVKQLSLPTRADVVWTSQNYHDIHNVPQIDLLAFNKSMADALKSGGTYLVIDHTAASDAPADVTSTLHRINPEVVKQEVQAAGFKLAAESPLLKNPDDDHKANVFDAAIRGKTDQFLFKFRKSRK